MRKSVWGVGLIVSTGAILALGLVVEVPWKNQVKPLATHTVTVSRKASAPETEQATIPGPKSPSSVAREYVKLPLAFEPNVGQANSEAKFLARGDGYALFLTSTESILALNSSSKRASIESHTSNVLRMKLAGANAPGNFSGIDELPGKSNYFIGNEPAKWHTNVPNYRKVEQRGVYRGVDVIYYGTQGQLEYDCVVAPGADPSVIQLAFRGAEHLRTDSRGDLIISVAGGKMRLQKPVAYQESNAGKETVAANYVVEGKSTVTFKVGNYDPNRRLVIDPILSYSTYLGGSNIDGANAITVAPDNTAFVAGGTFSLDFPTAHPLQPNHGGPDDFSKDAFVSKLSADGSTLLYSTYLGGKNEDVGNGIAVDTFGSAYVTGTTLSPDFPVTPGSFNTECGGDAKCGASFNPGGLIVSNAFVTKLNAAGSALVYSGFLGEYENVKGQAITVDANQVAYVTGQTEANGVPTVVITPPATPPPPFPITAGAAQTLFGGGATDAFLSKVSATGTSVLYSTYIGGSNEEIGYGVAVDSNANAYVTGLSYSTDFPVTGGAFQAANGGAGDAFLVKLSTAGGPFLYSTLLGGNGLDQGNGIAVDATGNAFITGVTASPGFTSPRPYSGNGDAFVAKFNPSLSGTASLIYFTYLGGSLADAGQGIAIDSSGNAYVTGSTVSLDFPVTAAVFQPKFGGGNADAFVTKLDPAGSTLVYSSYLGGTNTDIGYGIAADTSGNAYVAGQTCSLDFPLANPEQATPGGNCDAFVSKVSILSGIQLNPAGLVFPAQSLGTSSQPQTVTLTNGDNPLTIASIAVGGANPGDFSETNTCAAALPAGAQCTITVTFTPTAAGIRKASVTITDNAPGSPQVLNLSGQSSTLTLSVSNLSFGQQQVGTTSANPLPVVATNNGTTAVTFTSITASGDFAETDDCTKVPLQATTNCVINVTYTPSTAGSSVGALTLTDNAPGSPQIVLLTGTGFGQQSDFSMPAIQASSTVSAGQTATFGLQLSSTGGFSQAVSFTCGGLPQRAICSISPNPATPAGNPGTPVTVTISTAVRNLVPPTTRFKPVPFDGGRILKLLPMWLTILIVLVFLSGLRKQLKKAAFGLAVILLLVAVGCNSGNQSGVPAGTPAGAYQITVTGTSGAISHTTMLNLQVN
jgi:beta-propeller repeat-containing protein/ASPM-SPD-2-Hydin domain-containing protein